MSGSCLSPRDPVGLLRASGEEGGRGIAREISHVETESIIGKCELGWRSSMLAQGGTCGQLTQFGQVGYRAEP